MFFLILKSAFGETNADLHPPFFPSELNQVGCWDFGGCAKIYEEKILLVPPTQYHQGSAWSNVQIPEGDWSIQFDLGIDEGTGGGGFAIWIIDQLITSGTIHGGPDIFKGISISADILDDKLFVEIIQSNRIRRFLDYSKPTNSVVPIVNKNVSLHISFTKKEITIFYIDQITKNFIQIINQPLFLAISDFYIGLTAQSDEFTSLILLYSISFFVEKFSKDLFLGNRSLPHFSTSEHFSPHFEHKLRNPAFVSLRTEVLEFEKNNGNIFDINEDTTSAHVLNAIDEISTVCYETASFSELNEFIRKTIIPYTTAWQRRSHKIVKTVHDTKAMFQKMCEQSKKLADDFSAYKNKSLKKTDRTVEEIQMQFTESLKKELKFDEIIQKFTNQRILNLLFFISIIEVIFFVSFALYFLLQKRYI